MRNLLSFILMVSTLCGQTVVVKHRSGGGNSNGYTKGAVFTFNVHPASNLTAFPNLISGTYSQLADVAHGGYVTHAVTLNGQTVPADLIFTSDAAGSTLLSWEVESWNNVTGAVVAWVNSDRLAASDTLIYAWVGKSSVTTYQCTASSTWVSNYKPVLHFPGASLLDSTDTYSSTQSGGSSTTGQLDRSIALTGLSDSNVAIANGSNSISANNSFSVSLWVKSSVFANSPTLFDSQATGSADVFLELDTLGRLDWGVRNGATNYRSYNNSNISDGNWHYIVVVKTGSGDSGILYLDGAPQTPTSGTLSSTPTLNNLPLYLGKYTGLATLALNGSIDEFRVSSTNLSADWISHEYRQQAQASAWYTVGSWTP
jgi:hypothetical protein